MYNPHRLPLDPAKPVEGKVSFIRNAHAPGDILALERYNGGATMPLEYNATRKTCGLLVIFTK